MANIKDVAEKAGITVTTVSRILNNRGYISENTRKRVYDVMAELNYHPNEVARSLFKKRTNIVGMVIPDISHPFYSWLAKYIEIELYAQGFKMMLCNAIETSNREKEYLNMLQRNQVDGILNGSHTLDLQEYAKVGLPVVAIDRDLGETIPIVSSNHPEGGRLAAQKLIECGCKKVAQIMGYSHVKTPSNERHISFSEEMKNHGISCITTELKWNQFEFDDYSASIKSLLDMNPDIDGIFAVDLVAAAVMKEALQRGTRVPEDLKIVGYDGTYVSEVVTPTITTIRQPVPELAKCCVEIMLKLINNETIEKHHTMLDVELVEGFSTTR